MQATGIIAEYNPFHNGHQYHIRQAKKLTQQPVIVAMSGSFMQRGEPAILSKWQRAALAVSCGADLVLELPCAFTLRSAEFFAQGGVSLLAASGCVNALCCGVESAGCDFPALARIACDAGVQAQLQTLLRQGTSYASAWEQLFATHSEKLDKPLSSPNDILALSYTQAILRHGYDIEPLYVQRQDSGYNSTEISSTLASATAIRQALATGNASWQQAVPPAVQNALPHAGYDERLLWQLICYRLRLLSPEEIAARTECSEGLENRLKQAADCVRLAEAVAACSSKRYTASRCRRLLLQLLCDVPRETWAQQHAAYLRVLAFNDTGRQLLKQMKKTAALPLITKLGRGWQYNAGQAAACHTQLALELKATDIWSLLQKRPELNRQGNDYYLSPVYVK